MDEKLLIPNTTQIPNVILDMLLPALPEPETKCILYICRRTFGFGKVKDRISLSQFIGGIKTKDGRQLDYGTGLARPTVVNALRTLVDATALYLEETTKGNYYQLNLDMDIKVVIAFVIKRRELLQKIKRNKPTQKPLLKVVSAANQLARLTESGKRGEPIVVSAANPQNLEKPSNKTKTMQDAKAPAGDNSKKTKSPHAEFIKFWSETTQKTRSIKPLIAPMDGRNLRRVLDLNILTQAELQQLALYYLAHGSFKTFNPSISTFMSAGVLTGLMNRMKNDPNFWRETDAYMTHYLRQPSINSNAMVDRLAQLKAKLFVTT